MSHPYTHVVDDDNVCRVMFETGCVSPHLRAILGGAQRVRKFDAKTRNEVMLDTAFARDHTKIVCRLALARSSVNMITCSDYRLS